MENNYFLPILGSSVDTFLEATSYPCEGDFTHAKYLGNSAGGCPFNVGAVVASKGVKVKAIDMLGKDDDTTPFLLNEMKRLNMDSEFVEIRENVVNGKVFIVNTGDNRTMFVVDPVRPPYDMNQNIQDLLDNATYIYSLMHMINRSFSTIEPLLEAKKKGAKVVLDGSSKYDDPSRVKILYSLADGMFINENDFERLKENSDGDPRDIIFANGGEFICLTKGSKGATLYLKDREIYEPAMKGVKVLDSTGAGDSFAGGFISGIMMGYGYEKALRLATANGAYACTNFGGLGGVSSIDTLIDFAKEHDYEI